MWAPNNIEPGSGVNSDASFRARWACRSSSKRWKNIEAWMADRRPNRGVRLERPCKGGMSAVGWAFPKLSAKKSVSNISPGRNVAGKTCRL